MSFYIAKGSLFDQKVDAIVIPSQPSLKLEGIVGGQALEKCGKELTLELEQYHKINISECVIANSYNSNFKKVILVANPKWDGGNNNEEYNLKRSYLSCMYKAQDFGLNSIAFPLLSVGAYNYPKRKAIEIAIQTITDFVEDEELDVLLVIYDESIFKTYKDLFTKYKIIGGPLSKTTKEHLHIMKTERERFQWYLKDIEQVIEAGTESKTFADKLNYFISTHGLSKIDCYLGVISKNMFNNYLSGKVKPGKYTIVSLGINMRLQINEINELLASFGYMLDDRIDVDKIIMYGLMHDREIDQINEELSSGGFYPVLKVSKDKD